MNDQTVPNTTIGISAGTTRPRAKRSLLSVSLEKLLELIIRLSGVSAIIFVLAIFFFVFREAIPITFSEHFSLKEFLFS
ncbi:MAG: hypothetical protein ACM31E_02930, partial [Fibrobacterota bacterium]|nr:hypothetical protein [Chitinispirillaceae bacterium]